MYFYAPQAFWSEYPASLVPFPQFYPPQMQALECYQATYYPEQCLMPYQQSKTQKVQNQNSPSLLSLEKENNSNAQVVPGREIKNRNSRTEFGNFRQKQGRNILSNIFRQFLRYFFSNKEKSLELVGRIVQFRKFQLTAKNFYTQLLKRTNALKTYVRVAQIQSMIETKNGQLNGDEFAEIFRILLMVHLKHNHTSAIIYSGKVPKSSRDLHFSYGRRLEYMIRHQSRS